MSNIERLATFVGTNEIENEDLIVAFINEAETDTVKEKAIDRFFEGVQSNPFDEGFTYYDLVQHYEDILDETA